MRFFWRNFVSTLISFFLIHSSEWRGWKRIECLMFNILILNIKQSILFQFFNLKKMAKDGSKLPKVLTWIAFPDNIHLILSLWLIRNAVSFEASFRIRLSTMQLWHKRQWHSYFKAVKILLRYASILSINQSINYLGHIFRLLGFHFVLSHRGNFHTHSRVGGKARKWVGGMSGWVEGYFCVAFS